jgi:hypothetical protein
MSTNLSSLISAEAQKLSQAAQEAARGRSYQQSFDPYRDSNGNVVWTVIVVGTKPLQKWFKAASDLPTALEKAKSVLAKSGHTGSFTLALEGRSNILAKLGGK